MIQWAAGFASPSDPELNKIRDGIYGVFRKNVVFETPKLLFHEVFDWWTHPRFAMDWSVILAIERFQCKRPSWMDHVPLEEACSLGKECCLKLQPCWPVVAGPALLVAGYFVNMMNKVYFEFSSLALRVTDA